MNEQQLLQQRQQQLAEIYDPQEQFIQQQKAALPQQFNSQRSSLEQAKVNAFRDITNTAQRRGMFFSGFQPAEQARFLGERFLPGMQDISAREETARLGLMEQLIGLRGQRTGEMSKFQEQLRQESMDRQREQEALARQQQLVRTSAGGGAGQGSAPVRSGAPVQATLQQFGQIRGSIDQRLRSLAGKDRFVNPSDFQAAKRAAAQMGWSADLFNRNFARYINPAHAQDYYR